MTRTGAARRGLRVLVSAVVLGNPLTVGFVHPAPVGAAADGVPLVAVPKANCRPGDKVETGLQGQVPLGDRVSGRAAEGYQCNLDLVGGFKSRSFANFDTYRDCAYYTESPGGFGGRGADGHGNVIDVSDPAHPVRTATLTARAMGNAGESLRVSAERGLLVADHYGNGTTDPAVGTFPWLAVYDVAPDCRHPRLLADVAMPHGRGHEGWLSPDGLTYYMTSAFGRTTTAIDLTDPTHPLELATWPYAVHGGSTSEDGSRTYMASMAPDAVLVVDTTDVGPGKANAGRIVSTIPVPHNFANQGTYRLDYDGHPYLLSFGELTDDVAAGRCTNPADTNFDAPRIFDIADEQHPVMVAKFMSEVNDPAVCRQVVAEHTVYTGGLDKADPFWPLVSGLFVYDVHYCTPDRLRNPTILACATFLSGLRIYDIRDPRKPREIAYYNTGTVGGPGPDHEGSVPTVETAAARPVIRRDLGQVWWVTSHTGFHVARFAPGVWPFPGDDPCPGAYDYLQAQYDSGYAACRARAGR